MKLWHRQRHTCVFHKCYMHGLVNIFHFVVHLSPYYYEIYMAFINNHLLQVNQDCMFMNIYDATFTREKRVGTTESMNKKSIEVFSISSLLIYARQANFT